MTDTILRELPDLEQGSDAWHDQRRGMVTASVVGQLLTVGYQGAEAHPCPDCEADPYDPCRSKVKAKGFDRGPIIKTFHSARSDVAASHRDDQHLVIEPANNDTSRGVTTLLVAERITGYTEPTYVSDDMWRGITDEPIARDLYSEHHSQAREYGWMDRQGEGWRLGFSPDGVVGDDGLIEIKSRRSKKQLLTILADEVPTENIPQCQAGLLVSGRKWLDYVSYCGGMPLFVKRVFPDPRWFAAIVATVERFEKTAEEMTGRYRVAATGLPMTERIVETEMSL